MVYATHVSKKKTSQSEKVLGKNQVENNAGGYTFAVSIWDRLQRFLVLGAEGGTYYSNEKGLTKENAKCVFDCAEQNLNKTLQTIKDISLSGRAPKQSPAIFALALLMSDPKYSKETKKYVSGVCRTSTHLFEFVANCKELRGNGSALKKAVSNWYLEKSAKSVAYQVTKYKGRFGYTHRDLLRLYHPKPETEEMNRVFRYICQHENWLPTAGIEADEYLTAVEECKYLDEEGVANLIRNYGLVREHIPTEYLNSIKIWEALLERMPMTAMIRNLGKMSSIGLLKPFSNTSNFVTNKLVDESILQKSRIHPFNALIALNTYKQGMGFNGKNTWNVNQQILEALEETFNKSFKFIQPSNKRFYLGIDVSGSMGFAILGNSQTSCRTGASAMALTTVKTEPLTYTKGFTGKLEDLNITKKDSLESVINKTSLLPFGRTDCALPMIDALKQKLEVDCFVVYTDNETWCGNIHPFQALNEYRQKTGIDAKLIVCGMASNGFTIADPNDKGMLDIVGFDSSAPQILSSFANGDI